MARPDSLPSVEDVLAGRVEPSLVALFKLIGAVNPTGRGLSLSDQLRHYRDKARLQSLLIRRFRDEVVFVADDAGDDVVLLRHATSEHTACHAIIPSLDDDVRRWVRRRLDEEEAAAGGDPDPASPADDALVELVRDAPPSLDDEGGLAGLLTAGHVALAEYTADVRDERAGVSPEASHPGNP